MHIKSLAKCILMVSAISLAACESGDDLKPGGNNSGGGDDGGGAGAETDGPTGTPIDEAITLLDASQLCAIPELGPLLVDAAGEDCSSVEPSEGLPLSAEALCDIPEIGPALAEAAGATCPVGGGGSDPTEALPISLEDLCAVPELGPALVGAVGGSCGDTGGGEDPLPLGPDDLIVAMCNSPLVTLLEPLGTCN